jgi:predicted GNAT superfamily acetyltransferase
MTGVQPGVEVRGLTTADECHAASALYAEIWGLPVAESPLAGEVLVALAHSGNYVVGAFTASDALVGGATAWFGRDDEGRPFLHSHIAGVVPASQGLGVGMALKQHQRRWARERGVAEIRWTFDPLVRRNAWFNLVRLGGVGVRYEEDYYGGLDDGINAGNATDRMVVHWVVDQPTERETTPPAGAYPVLDVGRGDAPTIIDPDPPDTDLAVWLPEDIVGMRASHPDLARQWREAQRAVLAPAFARGYRATAVSPDGWLLLTAPD